LCAAQRVVEGNGRRVPAPHPVFRPLAATSGHRVVKVALEHGRTRLNGARLLTWWTKTLQSNVTYSFIYPNIIINIIANCLEYGE